MLVHVLLAAEQLHAQSALEFHVAHLSRMFGAKLFDVLFLAAEVLLPDLLLDQPQLLLLFLQDLLQAPNIGLKGELLGTRSIRTDRMETTKFHLRLLVREVHLALPRDLLDLLDDSGHRRPTSGTLCQAEPDEISDVDFEIQRKLRHLPLRLRARHLHLAQIAERDFLGKELEDNDAEGIYVGLLRNAAQLVVEHLGWRPHWRRSQKGRLSPDLVAYFGEPEVAKLHLKRAVEQDVGRLQVEVKHADLVEVSGATRNTHRQNQQLSRLEGHALRLV
mmetsp:Transcript_66013/g.183874  ORF Transcript_66013/g.183874 Transcript_66013/m.183874 type:complete len:276 (-) Transcript_66013:589-1416(-)